MPMGIIRIILFIPLLLLLQGCSAGSFGSAKPGNEPGMCNLNCGNAIIGSADSFEIRGPEESQLTCAPTQTEIVTNWLFRVVEPLASAGGADADGGEAFRPVPFISFAVHTSYVAVFGENNDPSTTDLDLRCSDTCGVIAFDVTYACPVAGESANVTLQVTSGGLFSDLTNVTITTQDVE